MTDQASEETELLDLYFEESRELLEGIESDLLTLESTGVTGSPDLIHRVFRAIHSVKGGAGFFNLGQVQALAHAMENVLGAIRDGDLPASPKVVEPLLAGADALNQRFHQSPSDPESDLGALVEAVRTAAEAEAVGASVQAPEPAPSRAAPAGFEPLTETERAEAEEALGPSYETLVWCIPASRAQDAYLDRLVEEAAQLCHVLRVSALTSPQATLHAPEAMAETTLQLLLATTLPIPALAEALEASETEFLTMPEAPDLAPAAASQPERTGAKAPSTPAKERLIEAPEPPPSPREAVAAPKPAATAANPESASIRVRLPTLDRLMTLAGELVLARNQLVQGVGTENSQVLEASQRIDHITTELQDAIMSTRMQSVGTVFHKFRRIVRDLSKQLGKQVELTIEGEDVELDRTVIESIGDPLTHLVRNALDHGLETPAERRAAGKPAIGQLRLIAAHKAGNVIIEITEDGRGINSEKVRALAISRGMYTADELAGMSTQGINRIIMQPGFSTAATVTDISGRGVGMDVVGSNIKRLGGSVDVQSTFGQGTTVRVKLPLTLAIIPALLVTEEGRRFAIPQANLIELHRIPAAKTSERILALGNAEVLTLRGSLLPIVRLRDALNMPDRTFVNETGVRQRDTRRTVGDHRRVDPNTPPLHQRRRSVSSAVHVAVVSAGEFSYGLVLESWQETSEIVVKPLGRHLRQSTAYAGATILGDGNSALILDVTGIGARLTKELASAPPDTHRRLSGVASEAHHPLPTLVIKGFSEQFYAIPLELITRVERTTPDRLQTIMGATTLRYNGGSLPLISADIAADSPTFGRHGGYVAVFRHNQAEIGVFAADLLDITSTTRNIDTVSMRRPGCLGSFHLGEALVLVLDLPALATEHFSKLRGAGASLTMKQGDVLIVDPSDFFRTSLARTLAGMGYDVTEANSAQTAVEQLSLGTRSTTSIIIDLDILTVDEVSRVVSAASADPQRLIGTTSAPPPSAAILERGRSAGIERIYGKMSHSHIGDGLDALVRFDDTNTRLAS